MKPLIGSTVAVLLFAIPPVYADDAATLPAYGPIPFSAYDTNRDGTISEQEFNAVRSQRVGQKAQQGRPMRGGANMPTFADFDTNGDDEITEQEYVAARNKRIAERASAGYPMRGLNQAEEFKDIDTNHDGRITQEEFAAHQRKHWQNTRPSR